MQSAVSAAIANIEGRHATKLFHRVGRGIELTEVGRVFLVEARAVLARAEAAEPVLADLSGMRRGTLALYASRTIARDWLPRHLVAFRRAYPEIAHRLVVGNTTDTADAVRAGQVELGLVEGRRPAWLRVRPRAPARGRSALTWCAAWPLLPPTKTGLHQRPPWQGSKLMWAGPGG